MIKYGLTVKETADLICNGSIDTVKNWRATPGTTRHRNMPDKKLTEFKEALKDVEPKRLRYRRRRPNEL